MDTSVTITRARHAWPEGKGFLLHRPRGIKEWTFLHFHSSVRILVRGQEITAPAGACVFYAPDTPQWFQSPGQLVHDWMHMTGPAEEDLRRVGLEPDTLYLLAQNFRLDIYEPVTNLPDASVANTAG